QNGVGLQNDIGIDNDHIDVAAAVLVDGAEGILLTDVGTIVPPAGAQLVVLVVAAGDVPHSVPILGHVVQGVLLAVDGDGVVVVVANAANVAHNAFHHGAAFVHADHHGAVILVQHGDIHSEQVGVISGAFHGVGSAIVCGAAVHRLDG